MTLRILNLYSGIGGNRKLWGNHHQITAIELNPEIARLYQQNFPNDKVIVADAHQYLLENYKNFDLIWSSPPCQSHSSFRHNIDVKLRGTEPVYPEMTLYQEIIFLKHHFEGDWIVENVRPYYEPLIKPSFVLQRHYFWSNKVVADKEFPKDNQRSRNKIVELEEHYGLSVSNSKLPNKRQVLRNCVLPAVGAYILQEIISNE